MVLADACRIEEEGFDDVFADAMTQSPLPDSATGDLVFSGIGNLADFPAEVAGNIALIERGSTTFGEKSQNAQEAGAEAAIIYSNESGGFSGALCNDITTCPENPILTVSVSREDAEAALLPHAGSPITMSRTRVSTYSLKSGTSMATPHVAGIAALLKALAPTATPAEIRSAMEATARDLCDPGYDTTYGWGLADADAAGWNLAPARFQQAGTTHRRRPVSRPSTGG